LISAYRNLCPDANPSLVASGQTLGPNQRIILHLLDIEPMVAKLKGLVMELEDCAYPLLAGAC